MQFGSIVKVMYTTATDPSNITPGMCGRVIGTFWDGYGPVMTVEFPNIPSANISADQLELVEP